MPNEIPTCRAPSLLFTLAKRKCFSLQSGCIYDVIWKIWVTAVPFFQQKSGNYDEIYVPKKPEYACMPESHVARLGAPRLWYIIFISISQSHLCKF